MSDVDLPPGGDVTVSGKGLLESCVWDESATIVARTGHAIHENLTVKQDTTVKV